MRSPILCHTADGDVTLLVLPHILASARFGPLDWLVIVGYFALLAGVGIVVSRRTKSSDDFFLGGRRMPMWAVAFSLLASATSAATFIGGPEEAYVGNLTYVSTNIGTALAVVLVAVIFIPAFYRHKVTTVYDLLRDRFGPGARSAASLTFMIGRVVASGSRIFVAALPASMILFGDTQAWQMVLAIAVITAAGILTACFGGIRSVIWTDVIQVLVYVGAAVAAIAVLLTIIPLSLPEIISTLRNTPVGDSAAATNKLTVLRTGIDPAKPGLGLNFAESYTLLTAIFGFSLLNLAAYGTDHDLTQRMLTCKSAIRGSGSALLALLFNLPILFLFMSIGPLLFILYQRPELMGDRWPGAPPTDSSKVFLHFILTEMPAGLKGLMMAGLFAVGVGSLNSAIGAMAATAVSDFYRPLRPGREDAHYARMARFAVIAWGCILGLFACWCIAWYASGDAATLIQFVLGAMTFAYAGLLGVFLTALLTKRGTTRSCILAIIVGFVLVLLMQPTVWGRWTGLSSLTRATPNNPNDWRLGELRLAFPWRLTLAVTVCFIIAAWPRGARHRPMAHDETGRA